MGMYTGLRCRIKVKEEYVSALEELDKLDYEWSEHSLKEFREFGDVDRATFIPRGCLSYMPDCWEQLKENHHEFKNDWEKVEDVEEFKRNFDNETRIWSFQCSLKNYEDTIEQFIEKIVALIAEDIIHLEELYEESALSTLYVMNSDGDIVESNESYRYLDYNEVSLEKPMLESEWEKMNCKEQRFSMKWF